jgi:hypothetical protein
MRETALCSGRLMKGDRQQQGNIQQLLRNDLSLHPSIQSKVWKRLSKDVHGHLDVLIRVIELRMGARVLSLMI